MWLCLISLFPDMVKSALADGVVGRAIESKSLDLVLLNPRDYTDDVHRTVDDRPFGGGPGMVMKPEPLSRSVEEAKRLCPEEEILTIYLTPQGQVLQQAMVRKLADKSAIIMISGRYEGVDERFIESHVDMELSIGDFVLSGGELPALVLIDAIGRLLDGTLGNRESSLDDSFSESLLECPQYTKPRDFEGKHVPEVLLSGDHERIRQWRRGQSLLRTHKRRPDLLLKHEWTELDKRLFRSTQENS